MELLFITLYMLLNVLLAIIVPTLIIVLVIAILKHNAPSFTAHQKEIIQAIGEEVRKTKEITGTIDNKDINALIKQYNIKDKDLINYVLKKYGKGIK